MAKTTEQFDQHFKEKLDGHREKPSALAWERLQNQLPKESKPAFGIWWAVAASITALLVAGYSFWPGETGVSEEVLLAEKTEMPMKTETESSNQTPSIVEEIIYKEEIIEPIKTEIQPKQTPQSDQKTTPTPLQTENQAPQNLVAEVEIETNKNPIVVPVPELRTEEIQVTLPELKAPSIEKMVAESNSQADEEPLYRVSIYSNGVKKGEPQDKNLITELGKTVSQVEGLIGKVDDGLISLQDKKDNLFASLTTKKSQADEKP